MKGSKPKLIMNTPIRSRDTSQQGQPAVARTLLTPSRVNKENSGNMIQSDFYTNKSSLSPNKVVASRKPIITGKPQPQQYNTLPNPQEPSGVSLQWRQPRATEQKPALASSRTKQCANHPEKEAEFKIIIEGEVMQYCAKCSAHLASQGFPVEKLVDARGARRSSLTVTSPNNPIMESKPQNIDPSIASHPRYSEIMSFLSSISAVDQQLRKNGQTFAQLPAHYKQQIQLLEEFYDAMVDYMKHVKSQHLNIIKTELRKYVQIGEIECGEVEDSTAELDYIVSDMQGNITSIVKEITEEKYRECFNFYSQKVELYRHRAEEQVATLQEVTQMGKDQLSAKLQQFRNAVNEMFGIKEVFTNPHFSQTQNLPNLQSNLTPKQPTPIAGKKLAQHSNRQPSSGPFRNLFSDQAVEQVQQGLPDESPQFKNI